MEEPFFHGNGCLTRFPPNIEQVSVRHDSVRSWLIVRRNDVTLEFPLRPEDCEHLIRLLDRGDRDANVVRETEAA